MSSRSAVEKKLLFFHKISKFPEIVLTSHEALRAASLIFYSGGYIMKRFLLVFFSFLLSGSLYASDWGVPPWLYSMTVTIEDYSGSDMDLDRCHQHGDYFYNYLVSGISSNGYSITTFRNNVKDSQALKSYVTTYSDSYHFVFFSGHGNTYGPRLYDSTLYSYNKAFGGATRWVFFDCCLTLNTTYASMRQRFNGVHSIFGFVSLSYEFSKVIAISSWPFFKTVKSEYQWSDFSDRWTDGSDMYTAFRTSVKEKIVDDGDHDVEIASFHLRGAVDGQYLYGHREVISNVYNQPLTISEASDGFWKTRTVWGNPEY